MTKSDQLAQVAQKVLDDPVLLRKLSDRVYELMQEELLNQQERQGTWRRRL